MGTDAHALAMDGHRHSSSRRFPVSLALATALAIAVAGPATAVADDAPAARWPAGGSTLRTALTMGAEHWARTPCRGRVSMTWSGGLRAGLNAQSTWANAVDPYLQPARNTDCAIVLSTTVAWDWPKLCTVVIHEVGHLTGHDHVDDPTDIMYYAYMEPAPECRVTPEPVETGPPPPAPPAAPATPAAAPRANATQATSAPRRKQPKAVNRRKAAPRKHRR